MEKQYPTWCNTVMERTIYDVYDGVLTYIVDKKGNVIAKDIDNEEISYTLSQLTNQVAIRLSIGLGNQQSVSDALDKFYKNNYLSDIDKVKKFRVIGKCKQP